MIQKHLSNLAAGTTHAVLLFAFVAACVIWRGTGAEYAEQMTPIFVLQVFVAIAFVMTLAFGGLQSIWEIIASDIGLSDFLTSALGCTATMLLFGGISLASGGLNQEFGIAAIAISSVFAFIAGSVRHWVGRA